MCRNWKMIFIMKIKINRRKKIQFRIKKMLEIVTRYQVTIDLALIKTIM